MPGLCTGRACVVTGSAGGIGRAHVEALVAEGAQVVVNDLDPVAVEEAVEAMRAVGGDVVGCPADVSTAVGADTLVTTALDTWGHIDVVVNNAGITRDRMIVNMSEEDWDDVVRVHLTSTFLVTRQAARHWRQLAKASEPADARVVNTVSSVGLYGHAGQSNYGAAKAGIASFTVIAAMELARYGVTANALCPTALTPMTQAVGLGDTEDARSGAFDPRWVSPALVWLASPLSADVTGRVIVASGKRLAIAEGWHRGPTASPVDDAAEVDSVLRRLLAESAPNADVQGDIPDPS